MKKNNVAPKIIYSLAAILQVGLLAAVFVIQYLSDKKAGVMRHLYTRKMQYETTIFSPENLNIQKIIVIIIAIILLELTFLAIKNRKSTFLKIQSILGVLLSLVLYLLISSSYFSDMLAYPYFIIVLAIVLFIQLIVIFTAILKNNKTKDY